MKNSIAVLPLIVADAEPLMCFQNVQEQVARKGGTAQHGWEWSEMREYFVAVAHSVWRDEDGNLWDITPKMVAETYTAEWIGCDKFEPDNTIVYQPGKKIGSRHIAKNPADADIIALFERSEHALHNGDLEKCRYWTNKANAIACRRWKGATGWQVPASLDVGDYLATCL